MPKKKKINRSKFAIVALIIIILLFSVVGVAFIYIGGTPNNQQPVYDTVTPQVEVGTGSDTDAATGTVATGTVATGSVSTGSNGTGTTVTPTINVQEVNDGESNITVNTDNQQ